MSYNNHNQNSTNLATKENLSKINIMAQRSSSVNLSQKLSSSSCLEFLDAEEQKDLKLCNGVKRTSSDTSHNIGSCPPRPDSTGSCNQRAQTPIKQVSLQAVKRKDDSDTLIAINIDHTDLKDRRPKSRENSVTECLSKRSEINVSAANSSSLHKSSNGSTCKLTDSCKMKGNLVSSSSASSVAESDSKESVAGEEESSDDTTEDEEEEKKKAPNQLLMEFVTCLMEKDYLNAQKLCTMILLYEPDHQEALKFKSLIDEKLELDDESESESDEDDDDDEEDDDSDDSDDESDTSDSDDD